MIDNGTEPRPDAVTSTSGPVKVAYALDTANFKYGAWVRINELANNDGTYFVSDYSNNAGNVHIRAFDTEGDVCTTLHRPGDKYEYWDGWLRDYQDAVKRFEAWTDLSFPGSAKNVGGHAVVQVHYVKPQTVEHRNTAPTVLHKASFTHKARAKCENGIVITKFCDWHFRRTTWDYWTPDQPTTEEWTGSSNITPTWADKAQVWNMGEPQVGQVIPAAYYGREPEKRPRYDFEAKATMGGHSITKTIAVIVSKGSRTSHVTNAVGDATVQEDLHRDAPMAKQPATPQTVNWPANIPAVNRNVNLTWDSELASSITDGVRLALNSSVVTSALGTATAGVVSACWSIVEGITGALIKHKNSVIVWSEPQVTLQKPEGVTAQTLRWQRYLYVQKRTSTAEWQAEGVYSTGLREKADLGTQTDELWLNSSESYIMTNPRITQMPDWHVDGWPDAATGNT